MTRLPSKRPRPRTVSARFGLASLALVLSGCGKPATEADCEHIVTRVTQLELQAAKIGDPVQIQAQIEDAKRSFKERALKECVGKRLGRGSLECVDKATTAKQLVEECF